MCLDEAEDMGNIQPNRQQKIPMNFLRMAHVYKPSDRYWIWHGIWYYTFGEVMPKVEGLLARLVTSQALGYPTCRSGLVVLDVRGFWTEASACVLCRPSVVVQVFQVIGR